MPLSARSASTSSNASHSRAGSEVALLDGAPVVVGEAVHAEHLVAALQQPLADVRAEEPGGAGHEDALSHERGILGFPNTMRAVARSAGFIEVWAARAWNVFNEGRPFTLVYPVLVLCVAALVGLAPEGSLGLALLGSVALAAVLVALPVPAPRPRAALARARRQRAAARAVARPGARAGRAGRLGVLHRLLLGHLLLPAAHRGAVDELPPLLAPRPDELGPHERQRARAGAEDRDDDLRRRAAGRGARRGQRGPDRGGRADRGRAGRDRVEALRPPPAVVPGARQGV